MDIRIATEKIDSEPKEMDFGKLAVCSKCGSVVWKRSSLCCGGIIPLKQYVEEVRGEKFNNEEWAFEDMDINLINDKDDKDITHG